MKIRDEIGVKISNLNNALFTGDTLFIGGCGWFFEGIPKQMLSAMDKISSLGDETLIFCGHEYTLQNYSFTLKFDKDNEFLKSHIEEAKG